MSLHRCRVCRSDYPTYRELRHHAEDDHPDYFLEVSRWLGRSVTPRIEQLERIASEGLTGYREHKSE